jgi:hypothetical protein
MKTAKRIAAIVLAATLVLALQSVAQRGCAGFQAWITAAFAYENLVSLLLPAIALAFLYGPIHDLVALLCYALRLEPHFEGAPLFAKGKTTPMTLRQKLIYGYPSGLIFGLAFAYVWSLAIRCG